LNLGCGGGKNVFNLKHDYTVTGLDLSPQMLDLARDLNPECEFVQGDMRRFNLGRMFDAVLVDDAISYMTTRPDLRAVFVAAWEHLLPGGVMVVTPDVTKETFAQNRTVATPATAATKPPNIDVVFVENIYDPNPNDDHYEGTMIYLIREDGRLQIETDCHHFGLFSLDLWRTTLTKIGFEVYERTYVEQDTEYVMFTCRKPV
jgi:SAM-dependent methyltransferase